LGSLPVYEARGVVVFLFCKMGKKRGKGGPIKTSSKKTAVEEDKRSSGKTPKRPTGDARDAQPKEKEARGRPSTKSQPRKDSER
jgi:hypothetical protein